MYPKTLSLFSKTEALKEQSNLLSLMDDLRNDYLKIDDSSFYNDYVFHESVFMKCLAYRFANKDFWEILKKKIVPNLEKILGLKNLKESNFFVHPLFYCRLSDPKYKNNNSNHFLDSQPHYDRSFDLEAYTFWLALEEISEETGGICFFDMNDDMEKLFNIPWGKKNKYNYDTYIQNSNFLDKFIEKNLKYAKLKLGQCYMFDSFTLHGATKPKSAKRISFDFRLIPKDNIMKIDKKNKNLIEKFNSEINESNKKNLIILGDTKGANKYYPEYLSDNLIPKYNILQKTNKLYWKDEYSWLH